MRAILILLVALIYTSAAAMAEVRSFSTIQPLVPNYGYYGGNPSYLTPAIPAVPAVPAVTANSLMNQISYENLSQMEMILFNRSYRDLPINRIARMENRLFGYVQQGEITQRFLMLQEAINQYSLSRYQNTQQNFYNTQPTTQTGWKGILSNLGGLIIGNSMGVPTGYSPQVDPFNNNGLGTLGGYGSGSGYTVDKGIFGNGYSNSNSGGNMGTGVHIMY